MPLLLNENISFSLYSDPKFNVRVVKFVLEDNPASITIHLKVANHEFFSKITYQSIPTWQALWDICGGYYLAPSILGAVVAWDSMRFLSLGGEELILCDGLEIDELTKQFWRHCFLNQFGEWRYLNKFAYSSEVFPQIICSTSNNYSSEILKNKIVPHAKAKKKRWLLANGGGKDTLVGMLLFNDAKSIYDIYEGYLPIGGSWELQASLLKNLRTGIVPKSSNVISVTVQDNFFTLDEESMVKMGIKAKFFKTDFAVGHTANYPGYFPLILYHDYSHIWFNIEASADRGMVSWNGEYINHQWCKSEEYQKGSTELFHRITGYHEFRGFFSTLRGLYDIHIYAIASTNSELLKKTHSCNYGKPWCRKCPKCCFSYLMMCSIKDESFALEVVGGQKSLFEMDENIEHWYDLLDSSRVAWECVPSHEECLIAVKICIQKGIHHKVLDHFAEQVEMQFDQVQNRYMAVNWSNVPHELRNVTLARIGRSNTELYSDVVIVGGGQSGLSMSHTLQQNNINHIVLESQKEGASWETRWDSFQLNTPNRDFNLPGKMYSGTDLDGFSTKHEVIEFFRDYSQQFNLPVICNMPVISVERCGTEFIVKTIAAKIRTKSVIAATGEYINPRLPKFEGNIPNEINWLHSRDYRSPTQLKPGAVLVVGGGQSGAQISEDLLNNDRKVYWSLSDRPSNVRRLRGKDFMEWWNIGGILHRDVEDHPEVITDNHNALRRVRSMEFPLVSGTHGNGLGHSISLQKLAESGITLLGKLRKFENSVAFFNEKVGDQIQKAIKGSQQEYKMLMGFADNYYKENEESFCNDSHFIPLEFLTGWSLNYQINSIDLIQEGLSTIIFATGYNSDWSWLKISNAFDVMGYPIGKQGVSPIPGLYFLGLFNLQRLSSTCLCNGGRDAMTLMPHISEHIDYTSKINKNNTNPSKKKILAILPTEQDNKNLSRIASIEGYDIYHINDLCYPFTGDTAEFNIVSYTRSCIMQAILLKIDGVFYSHSLAGLIASAICEYANVKGTPIDAVFQTTHSEFSNGIGKNNIWRYFVRLGIEHSMPDFIPFPVHINSACLSLKHSQTSIYNLNDLQKYLTKLSQEADKVDRVYRDFFSYYVDTVKYPGCIRSVLTIEETRADDTEECTIEGWCDDTGTPHLWAIETKQSSYILNYKLLEKLKNKAFCMIHELGFKRTFWHIHIWIKEEQLYVVNIRGHANFNLASLYMTKYGSDLYKAVLAVACGDFSDVEHICPYYVDFTNIPLKLENLEK